MKLKEVIVQTPPPPPQPAVVSFEQMQSREGIYKYEGTDRYYDKARWVTLSYGEGFSTLYIAGKDIQPCSPTAWKATKFVRTDEQLQVTIK